MFNSLQPHRLEPGRLLCHDPWVRKTPWIRKWQPTPVFLPGKSHGQRSLADHSARGRKRVRCSVGTKPEHKCYHTVSVFICSLRLCWVSAAMWALPPAVVSGDHSPAALPGLLTDVASPVAQHGLQGPWASEEVMLSVMRVMLGRHERN